MQRYAKWSKLKDAIIIIDLSHIDFNCFLLKQFKANFAVNFTALNFYLLYSKSSFVYSLI